MLRLNHVIEAHADGYRWGERTCLSLVGSWIDHRFAWQDEASEQDAMARGRKAYRTLAAYYRGELGKAGCARADEPFVGAVGLVLSPWRCRDGTRDDGHPTLCLIGTDGYPWHVCEAGLSIVTDGDIEWWRSSGHF